MSEPTFVLIQTEGWNPETQQDGPTDSIAVSVMLPVSGHEGKWFSYEFKSPDDLWITLQELDRNRDETLRKVFGYTGPPAPPKLKTADELLNELGSI